jgi:hypothetical protein
MYQMQVTFERDRNDDLPIARANFPGVPDAVALRNQLARELQSACDNDGLAGFFTVETPD